MRCLPCSRDLNFEPFNPDLMPDNRLDDTYAASKEGVIGLTMTRYAPKLIALIKRSTLPNEIFGAFIIFELLP